MVLLLYSGAGKLDSWRQQIRGPVWEAAFVEIECLPTSDDTSLNDFTYDGDAAGVQCPLGAHVRRANPRTADSPGGERGLLRSLLRMLGFPRQDMRSDIIASSRFHRIIAFPPNSATRQRIWSRFVAAGCIDGAGRFWPGGTRYLFRFLNANIARQFEFIQNAWMMNTKFDGLGEENDPLLGHQGPVSAAQNSDSFSIPHSHGVREHFNGLPAFVTVRGGAYFVLPGISALRYVAQLND